MENIFSQIISENSYRGDMIDEEQLIKKSILGSKEAFISLVDIHKEYLYKTAFLYVKNEHDASDIYQETIYKAFISIRKLKKSEYFKTWITRILINNVNDKIRKDSKVVFIKEEDNLTDSTYDVNLVSNIDLYNGIDKLSEKYKTPIILRYIHDMSIKDVASIIGASENTTKSYIYRALRILKTNLGEV